MRYFPASLALVVCLVAGWGCYVGFKKLLVPPDAVFSGPGDFVFHAPVAGDYTIWHRCVGVVDDEYRVAKPLLPAGTRLRVERDGHTVELVADGTMSSSTNAGQKVSLVRFKAAAPGEYRIVTGGFDGKLSFEITHGSFLGPFLGVFSSFGLAVTFGAAAVGLAVLAATGTFPKRKDAPPPKLAVGS